MLRLETQSWESTSRLTDCVMGLCSDLGTESGLTTVSDVRITESFWYWHPDEDVLMDDCGAMSAAAPPADPSAAEQARITAPTVSLSGSLFVPGAFHVVDGLSKAFGEHVTYMCPRPTVPSLTHMPCPLN